MSILLVSGIYHYLSNGFYIYICSGPVHERELFMNGPGLFATITYIRLVKLYRVNLIKWVREMASGDEQRHLVGIPT